MMKKYRIACAVILAALTAPSAFAASVCDEILQSKMESIIGLPIVKQTPTRTAFSVGCVYKTAATASGPAFFVIDRYTRVVQPEEVFGLMMTHQPTDVMPLAGLGERAWQNTFQHEIAVMRGKETFKLMTRLCSPRPGPDETAEHAKARCLAVDQAAMTQVAQLLLMSAK